MNILLYITNDYERMLGTLSGKENDLRDMRFHTVIASNETTMIKEKATTMNGETILVIEKCTIIRRRKVRAIHEKNGG